MPVVFIPALLRDLTGGLDKVTLEGSSVSEVIDALDASFPGVKQRLLVDNHLKPGIAVIVDGEASAKRLRCRLTENSEVHFLPAMGGGSH